MPGRFAGPTGGTRCRSPSMDIKSATISESPDVVRWLTRRYYESAGRLPSVGRTFDWRSARWRLRPTSRGHPTADFVRVGCNESGSSIFLDLGDSTWRAVEIGPPAGKSSIGPTSISGDRPASARCRFRPRDGSLAPLLKYVNVEHADLPLLIGWLTAALRPTGPHPILVITGEQGSAKSTLARICRLLVDPHSAPSAPSPKTIAT